MLVLVDEDLGITRVSPFTSVQDIGRITNEKTARSQIKGGVVGESARYTETAGWFPIDTFIEAAEVNDYDALVIGGGAWNPDALRQNQDVLKFVKNFVEKRKTSRCQFATGRGF